MIFSGFVGRCRFPWSDQLVCCLGLASKSTLLSLALYTIQLLNNWIEVHVSFGLKKVVKEHNPCTVVEQLVSCLVELLVFLNGIEFWYGYCCQQQGSSAVASSSVSSPSLASTPVTPASAMAVAGTERLKLSQWRKVWLVLAAHAKPDLSKFYFSGVFLEREQSSTVSRMWGNLNVRSCCTATAFRIVVCLIIYLFLKNLHEFYRDFYWENNVFTYLHVSDKGICICIGATYANTSFVSTLKSQVEL